MFERALINFNYNTFENLEALQIAHPHVSMREGYVLDAFFAGHQSFAVMKLYARSLSPTGRYMPVPAEEMEDERGDISYAAMANWDETADPDREVIPFVDGQFVHNIIPTWAGNTVPSITTYLKVPFEPRAIWEATLLVEASHLYLSHFRDGRRTNGTLVINALSLWHLCTRRGIDCSVIVNDSRIEPSVEMVSDDKCFVSYCYWCHMRGLVRKSIKVTRLEDEGISIDVLGEEILLEHQDIKDD